MNKYKIDILALQETAINQTKVDMRKNTLATLVVMFKSEKNNRKMVKRNALKRE